MYIRKLCPITDVEIILKLFSLSALVLRDLLMIIVLLTTPHCNILFLNLRVFKC